MKKFMLALSLALAQLTSQSQTISTFESLSLPLNSYWNGSDLSGGFSSGNGFFANSYDTAFFSWSGFAYSNMTDSTTAGWGNQYSAVTAVGYNASQNYAVADEYGNAKINLTGSATGGLVLGTYITNATYAYISMRDGDAFAKKFGGTTGNDADWFKLTAKGWLNGAMKSEQVEFYLADFRSNDNTQDYIVRDWRWLNLLPLGNVDSLQFFLSSSDTGAFGMNTPAYFCLDDFTTLNVANDAPIAVDDALTIRYDQDTVVNVLANDTDVTLTPLMLSLLTSPQIAGAQASVVGNEIYYTPALGIVANDTIWYSVCDAAGLCDTAQLSISITSLQSANSLSDINARVFPNPFSDVLQLELPSDAVNVQLLDQQGRVLQAQNTHNPVVLNTSTLHAGMYLLRVQTQSGVYSTQVIKQ